MPISNISRAGSVSNGQLTQLPPASSEVENVDTEIEAAGEVSSDWYGSLREEILRWYVISNDPTERSDEFLQQHIALAEQQR